MGCLSGEERPWLESASCILGGGEAGGFVGCVSKNGVALHFSVRERECGPDPGTSRMISWDSLGCVSHIPWHRHS